MTNPILWRVRRIAGAFLFLAAIVSCTQRVVAPSPEPTNSPSAPVKATSTSVWDALMETTPHAYFTPLPEPVPSEIDGIYAKIDASPPLWWRCYRCADYRPAGGIWRLQFKESVMRIYYEVTGWRTLASFTTEGDRLYLFNDPFCPQDVGEYQWQLIDGQLLLEAVDDHCAFDLRAKNFSSQPWVVCTASNEKKTPGCAERIPSPEPVARPELDVDVHVYGGDSRFFAKPPELVAIANTADREAPEGFSISYDSNTIPYGVHRVLWWNGSWIEATTDLPFNAIGVQFFGEAQIGWARVLFDGEEVWRGNTADLYEKLGRHGGYIEITGFEPGRHTIRAESLGFDYRPVTVVSFGFSRNGGVEVANP